MNSTSAHHTNGTPQSGPADDRPRVLIIGAGSRGNAYASPLHASGQARIAAVAELLASQRTAFGRKFIWGPAGRAEPAPHEAFAGWEEWVAYETARRERVAAATGTEMDEAGGVDIAFVCVLDEQHEAVVRALAPLGIHVMCEKPLSTSLGSCLAIYGALTKEWERLGRKTVFGIGHVLRYSTHNVLLRKLVREEGVIGEVLSVEHTEPVGWWHFEHSYVRGNWRKESATAPSLLTKSCHDIDFLLWMLCSPVPGDSRPPHLPAHLSSSGSVLFHRKARKPVAAGNATNCLSCPIEASCKHSAKRLYVDKHLKGANTRWPVKIVVPDIEDTWNSEGKQKAIDRLLEALGEDYDSDTPASEVEKRPWFGRCVFEADNDVCDDQTVTITWKDDPLPHSLTQNSSTEVGGLNGRGAKSATFHMVAFTEKICERRGYIYGTEGEIHYDSTNISVHNFNTGITKVYNVPPPPDSGHGGGDAQLALNMLKAVIAVRKGEMDVDQAQQKYLGCTLDEAIRSHAAVFAAEEARVQNRVVEWDEWWAREVDGPLKDVPVNGASTTTSYTGIFKNKAHAERGHGPVVHRD